MKDAYYFFKKGKILAQRGKFLDAIMMLEKAKDFEPEKGSIREVLASAYYNCGFYASAKNNFLAALKIDAANDFAHYGLGLCLVRENKLNRAVGHFKIAAVMNPGLKKYKKALEKFI
jgi:tetratricopeptide (TPR) repeat protein